MDDTEGTLYLSQMPSANSLSRISHAKMPEGELRRRYLFATLKCMLKNHKTRPRGASFFLSIKSEFNF